jgi:hyperosmotically inducible protein
LVIVCHQKHTLANDERRILMKAKLLVFPAVLLMASAVWAQGNQMQAPQQAEERIQREVRHQLLLLPYLTVFDNLSYKVEGYTVTLMGQVTRPTLKSDAENVVKHIEGVEKVNNEIEVLPTSPMDDGLRQRLYLAIY